MTRNQKPPEGYTPVHTRY